MHTRAPKIARGVINSEAIVDCVLSTSYILVYICIVYPGYLEISLSIILLLGLRRKNNKYDDQNFDEKCPLQTHWKFAMEDIFYIFLAHTFLSYLITIFRNSFAVLIK